jgi:hypothetical protein
MEAEQAIENEKSAPKVDEKAEEAESQALVQAEVKSK